MAVPGCVIREAVRRSATKGMIIIMQLNDRPLAGVLVVELATFVAAACCTRFLADQGANVIKIEPLDGDGLRYAAFTEGRPDLPGENIVYDIDNGNKRGMAMNLKDTKCFEILMALIGKADIFVTNWRPKALERMGLDYESLKKAYPKLIYGSVTGYGDKGPDMDLPGYDFSAFFARSGMLGSLYEKGTLPMNLIPSVGDRQAGMFLSAGLLAALYKAEKTGVGEKVSISLLGTAVFVQGTMIESSQYGLFSYPLHKRDSPNPLTCCYQTRDGRFVQLALPIISMFPLLAKALDMETWLTDPGFSKLDAESAHLFYDSIATRIAEFSTGDLVAALKREGVPFSLAQVWSEVLEDEQAWADDCFLEMDYPSGTRILVRNPVHFEEAGLPDFTKSPRLGQHTGEIIKELGYSDGDIQDLLDTGRIVIT